jgi:hypothetical protein
MVDYSTNDNDESYESLSAISSRDDSRFGGDGFSIEIRPVPILFNKFLYLANTSQSLLTIWWQPPNQATTGSGAR